MKSKAALHFGVIVPLFACTSSDKVSPPPPVEVAAETTSSDESLIVDGFAIPRLSTPPPEGLCMSLRSRATPLIECTTEAGESTLFELDTGTWWSVVKPTEAERLRLPIRPAPEGDVTPKVGYMKIDRCARFDRLLLGDRWTTTLDARIIDLPFDIGGLLGASVFGQFPILFDVDRKEVRLLPLDDTSFLATRYGDREWTELPIGWWSGIPYVTLTVRGSKVRLALDTGLTLTHLTPKAARTLGFEELESRTGEALDALGSHVVEGHLFHVEGMAYGDWTLEFDSWSPDLGVYPAEADGALGFDVLRRIPFLLDMRRDVLRILSPETLLDRAIRIDTMAEEHDMVRDPAFAVRRLAVAAMAKSGKKEYASTIATRLDDIDSSVSAEVARALAVFANATWPEESQVEQARLWWKAHRDDPEFAPAKK